MVRLGIERRRDGRVVVEEEKSPMSPKVRRTLWERRRKRCRNFVARIWVGEGVTRAERGVFQYLKMRDFEKKANLGTYQTKSIVHTIF